MDAKRGYVPEDDKNFSSDALKTMCTASRHILYLINEGYDRKMATTFVGNHFLLSERQRLAIMRSIATEDQLILRKSQQISFDELSGREIRIDGFNTIISLEVLLSDSPLFIGMDGVIRDLASLHGTYRIIPETETAIRLMFDLLKETGIRNATIYLDEPVSNSGRLKALIALIGEVYPFGLDFQVIKNVDQELFGKENVVTSDSIILDRSASWINLVSECHKRRNGRAIQVWEK